MANSQTVTLNLFQGPSIKKVPVDLAQRILENVQNDDVVALL